MRRSVVAVAVLSTLLLAVTPGAAAASTLSTTVARVSGWVPAPTAPFDRAAGVICDFAIHTEPTVDEVVTKVLQTYPDGSIRRDAFKGALVIRVTNTATGAYYDANASGSAVVDHHPDGSVTWYVVGPVLVGSRGKGGNVPRGLYVISGFYKVDISSAGAETLTMVHGHIDDVCASIA
jgi:hypothetical protein